MGSALGTSFFLVGIFGSEKSGTPFDRSRLISGKMTWGLSFPGIRVTCPGDAKAAEEKRLGRGLGWAKITNDTLIVFLVEHISKVMIICAEV